MKPTGVVRGMPSGWIISPWADLLLLIGTPLAIVPLVLWLGRTQFSAEQISLAVVSFASIGHHLPGFIRAYGDRLLFARFRWRFLLVPPLVLAISLVFAWKDYHGLSLVLLFWATWHVLMQTYGFMRIYDMKHGQTSQLDARLDFALCVAMFAAGMVFSDARMLAVVETMWRVGIPIGGPEWLIGTRWIVGSATVLVLAAFVARQLWLIAHRCSPSIIKLLLAISTGWIYWFTGMLAIDILVGVAMFEIFHAIQYDAVVWAYNRRAEERSAGALGVFGCLFSSGWSSVGMYLAAIVAFGLLRFFGDTITDPLAHKLLFAALAASTWLHFYFDGFIWKVSERKTGVNLGVSESASAPDTLKPLATAHGLRWVLLLSLLVTLYALEDRKSRLSTDSDEQMLNSLAAWIPELPEVQLRVSRDSLSRGDREAAVAAAARAVKNRPNSSQAQSSLGVALLQSERYAEAADALSEATRLDHDGWENFSDLGVAQSELGRWDAAEKSFAEAARLAPTQSSVETAWGQMCARRGDETNAALHKRRALLLDSSNIALRNTLVESLSLSGQHEAAIAEAQTGVKLAPDDAASYQTLGTALVAAGRAREALTPLQQSLRIDPASAASHCKWGVASTVSGDPIAGKKAFERALQLDDTYAPAHFQLGNARLAAGDVDRAVLSYRRAIELAPYFADGHANLGAALLRRGQAAEAAESLKQALSIRPNLATAHYNLGLAMLTQGAQEDARVHLLKSQELGQPLSPEVVEQLK